MYDKDRIELIFKTHDLPDELKKKYQEVKEKFKELALFIEENVPSCPHQTISINKVLEAKNAAVIGLVTENMKG